METNKQAAAAAEPEFAAFLAIDWADRKHVWHLQAADGGAVERGEVEHTPEAIHRWAAELTQRFAGQAIAVGLEQSRGPLIYQLSVYPQLVLYPVHPQTVANYRKAWHPSGAKDDPLDASLLLEILQQHRNHLRPLVADNEPTRQLRLLVEARRAAVEERTRHSNQLTDRLKQYYPQMLRWFQEPASVVVSALLEQWPTLEQLQQQDAKSLREFLRRQGVHSAERLESLLAEVREAVPATRDRALVEASVLAVQYHLRVLAALRQGIAEFERHIRQVAESHPDYAIFASLPGAGPALEPRLIALFGSNRKRYTSAAEVATFTGIAPVQKKSGKQCFVHFRFACPKFLRQTLHEWASHTITRSKWARIFYQQQRAKGNGHHAAVRALAFKWIRIVYRCWQDGVPYDEQIYLAALQRHGSPLAAPEDFLFKKCAGLWKFSATTS